jgi:low temperature requirement protein LtrA
MELFFDLVYVLLLTQLGHLLLEDASWAGAARTALLLVAIWWAWVDTAWATNWFDPGSRPVRLMLIAAMLSTLVTSAALPAAYGARGLAFAISYVVLHVGRSGFVVLAAPESDTALRRNWTRILLWRSAGGLLWLSGGVLVGHARVALWCAAVAVDLAGGLARFYVPGIGSTPTTDWNIVGGHMADRCELFVIIALGEAILSIGGTFARLHVTAPRAAAFVLVFLVAVALWWLYFDRAADQAAHVIDSSEEPGRLGRSAYSYDHLPMVAGIVLTAVADDLIITHPTGELGPTAAALAFGGPALFLAGHGLFTRSISGRVPWPRAGAACALAALAVPARDAQPVAAQLVPLAAISLVSLWDIRHYPTD